MCSQDGLTSPDLYCDPGYYCMTGAYNSQPTDDSIGGYCTIGCYCPKGASSPVSCPEGTFNVFKGCTSVSDCLSCPFGFICTGTTGTNALCPAGDYCPGNTTSSNVKVADPGYHTIAGQGAEIPCGPGNFTSTSGQTSCSSCTSGAYCGTSATSSPTACTAGYFCPTGTVTPYYCKEGTYRATTGATAESDCTPCDAGYYCSSLGQTAVDTTNVCAAGFYCAAGAFAASPAYTSATAAATFGLCTPGHYCPLQTSSPQSCSAGTYTPAYGNSAATDCFDCIPGEYCASAGEANPDGNCTAGYYCPSGSTSSTAYVCDLGYYCPEGSGQETKCVAGTYQDQTGQSSCKVCLAGYYCVSGSAASTTVCPQGYYCPANTSDYLQYPCAPGTFGAATGLTQASDCTSCTAGQYCTNYSLSAPTASCTGGYYCALSATSPTPTNSTQGGKCTAGQLCLEGSSAPADCPLYYVCNAETLFNASALSLCNNGFRCGTGLAYANPEGLGTVGDFCTAGSWCVGGKETACVAPTYLPSKGAGAISNISECLTCPYGYYCATDGLASPTGTCPAGYYCISGQSSGTANACQAGFQCPAGAVQETPCAPGMYQTATGQSSCLDCTAGNFCLYNSTTGTPSMTACPQGTMCASSDLEMPTSCAPAYYQDVTGQTTCKSCTAGNYCDRYQMTAQSACPAGYYCTAGQTTAGDNVCSPGYYCPAGSSAPTNCPAGMYCADYALASPSGSCSAGYYCTGKAKVPNPTDGDTGNICPSGYYCPDGATKTACPAGTYNEYTGAEDSTACIACEAGMQCTTAGLASPTVNCSAGTYCPGDGTVNTCPVGYMCPAGTVDKILCLPGTYQASTGMSSCDTCPAGKYCSIDSTLAITVALDCLAGFYCPAGTADYHSFPCPETTFNPITGAASSDACITCTEKFYCMSKGLSAVSGPCADGYTCPAGSKLPAASANLCSKNYYCTAGTATECPDKTFTYTGTAGNVLGATSSDNCMYCLPGNICTNHDTTVTSCTSGQYCINGVATDCPAGHYCGSGCYVPISCGIGNYSATTGASSCSACPAATYCSQTGTATPTACSSDLVCASGSIRGVPCDAGSYALNNVCVNCTAGNWCWPSAGGNIRGVCSDSYVCCSGADSPTPYYAGTKSSSDSDVNLYNGRAAKGCYTSNSLSTTTTVNALCPAGTYMPSMGTSECTPCPPGYYCPNAGMYDITNYACTAGYVCLGSATTPTPIDGTTGKQCDINYYCPAGTGFEIPCVDGTMALTSGKTACDACAVGYSCTFSAPHVACITNNTQCISGTSFEPLCQPGTYNMSSTSGCVGCPAGLFCLDGRSVAGPTDCANDNQCCTAGYLCTGWAQSSKPVSIGGHVCDLGYYCPEGATARQTCPDNTYIFKSGAIQQSDCTSCTEGYICTQGQAVAEACPVGNYCPTGINGSLPCPLGTYSNETGNTIVHDCASCPAGYFCSVTGIADYTLYPCPEGEYCFLRSQSGIDCPYGTYNNLTGAKTITGCSACPAGYYCPDLGQSNATTNSCSGGELCATGSVYPTVCPQGYYCNNNTGYLAVICPVNYYCPPNTSEPIACITGQYCPEGSYYPTVCVSGQISVMSNGTLTCETCPAGTYSISGLSTVCSTCEPGYVCLGGTSAKYPWSVTYHNGYKCPTGAYCPAGSSTPSYCPAGTYNPTEGQSDSTACLLCEANTFSPEEGEEACLPCGDSATADKGSATCTCKGANRAFLITDSSCRCKPGYEYLENGVIKKDVNSKQDCQPITYSRCSQYQIRASDGTCTSQNDCESECNGTSGTRSATLGICECKDVQRLDQVCNKACRDAMPSMTITSDGTIRVNEANDTYNYDPTYVYPTNLTNFNTEYMSCSSNQSCSATSVAFSSAGTVSASYGLGSGLAEAYLNQTAATSSRRRLLTSRERRLLASTVTSTAINDPVVCIALGDTLIFQLDGDGHYPVYQKDSLLNSNSDFDYAAFKILAETIAAELANGDSTAGYFAFTFTESGRYYFTDSISTNRTLIVTVTKASETCSSESAYIQSRTSSALSSLGVSQNGSIMLEPDYVMLAIILVSMVVALAMIMFLMHWVTDHIWKAKDASDPLFRKNHMKLDVSGAFLGKLMTAVDSSEGVNKFGIFKDADRKPVAGGDTSFLEEINDCVNMQKLEELDPFIIDKILKDYQAYKDYLQKELLVACEAQSKQIEDLGAATEKLKFLLNERYEKLIALLKLDVDYTKLSNVKIGMEEEKDEGKKREKRVKPSDIKLAKTEEKKATDLLKQVMAKRNEANVVSDIYKEAAAGEDSGEPDNTSKDHPTAGATPKNNAEELEERIRKGFEDRLNQMGDLTDFEKSKLRDELSSDLINLECVLTGERETQEIAIRRLLQGRRKKMSDPQMSKADKEAGINLAELSPEEKTVKEKVEQQIEDESRDRQREIEQRALSKIQKSKDRLLKELGAPENLSEKEKEIILSGHQSELEQMFETIKQDKDKQLEDLKQRLERRKQAKVTEQIKALREEQQPDIPADEGEAQISVPKETLESEVVQKLRAEEAAKEAELGRKHQEEKRALEAIHQGEIKEKEAELVEDLEIEVEKEIETKKEKMEENFKQRQQEVEDQRRKLKDKLLFSGGDSEAGKKLMEDIKAKDGQLQQLVEAEKKEQDWLIEEKINRRRIAKQKKLLAFQNAQHDASIELRLRQLKEKQDVQGRYETEKIKEIVRRTRASEPATTEQTTKLHQLFEQLWNEKEAAELANVFGRQLAEKEGKLRAIYGKNVEQKLMEKQAVKDRYRALYQDLEAQKPTMSPDDYATRQKQLRVEEENDLREADIKETMNQKKEEFALRQDLEEKCAGELSQLEDRLADEKLQAMRDLLGNQTETIMGNKMRELKEVIEREKDRRIKDIELDKKVILEKFENELKERFSSYEDIIRKQRETEKLIKEKKGNIERLIEERKKQMAELKDKALFTPEQEKQLLDKYQQELRTLETAMETERNRQFALMREKLESKEGKRERETSYHKKKVAFLMGTVGKNVTLAQAIANRAVAMQPKNELERNILNWKRDMEEREKSQKTTTFETLQKYLENVCKFKEKGIEGIYLQGIQYQKYLALMKAAKILMKKLEELHRIKASGALLDLKAALKIFAEDDFDRLKARPERIGGGYRCFDDEGNILWELFKFIHS
ncbi:MAG: SMC family ATPase [Terracidiphilus sp.]|nr:SMC family ATPase [Terracidiphilus sp.]